ncbi:type IIL restriction-modification enzyme MmeI [Corallococcus sp. AS-1-6]|uniref:type IIL restriction-modification enzyme MmeI n=1 Tax=Corallococcus sp. AS-1-6 TaxID=2874599 RepID=UPI001CC0C10D|nr:type IIL restriction-modification enzyme MmeI [Corallococcus sp. AS-1-6]MBZ4372049.1 N-6 DNA methylase [Corallococcus sp. AS-1-6]
MNGQGFGGDVERRYHQTWMGMAQPIEGLVVSIPVLEDAQCMQRLPVSAQSRFILLAGRESPRVTDVPRFLREVLGFSDDDFVTEFPEDLRLDIAEGHQTIRPTRALRRRGPPPAKPEGLPDDSTPVSRAAEGFALLTWELPLGLDLDKKEDTTGAWFYEPTAKFDRLLRAARVPIGLLFNGDCVRLVYAPHGETSGHLTFRFKDLVTSSGRPLFDAMVMLLHARRFFGVLPEHQLPALLEQSRRRQADVTEELADQVLEALSILLTGFETAAERDGSRALDEAFARGEDHVYGGLLSTLLRLVFILYAEDQGLLPVDQEPYRDDLSVKALHEQLVEDASQYPDAMNRRFGAWPRLLALFRCIYLGASHDKLRMPARRGQLFDPDRFPFLGGGTSDDAGTQAPTPSIDDETVHQVLERLIFLKGQRLSFKSLDVEQIGSVYEGLMGFHVKRLTGAGLCLKPSKVWVSADEVLAQPAKRRAAWLGEEAGLDTKAVKALAKTLEQAVTQQMVLAALEPYRVRGTETRRASQWVLQPGDERRRTSSHYTPRSLSTPIVQRALEPLLKTMGPQPSSERLLNLKICDPAMGSGAFLVESCRFLADQVVAAWTREGVLKRDKHEDEVMRARRLVAQRCLYGVDKNPWAVSLAKLSLWLVTLAKTEPFTFLDHALKCGDSLVGLDLEQLQAFHWDPASKKQSELPWALINNQLTRSLEKRERILQLALDLEGPERKPLQLDLDPGRVKEGLLGDADAALADVKRIANACVGAFFAHGSDKEREKERVRRLDRIGAWLAQEKKGVLPPMPADIAAFSAPSWTFHWPLEFPEVFHGSRPDPLDNEQPNKAAWIDGFVGNPPFAGKNAIIETGGENYLPWLQAVHEGAHGNADLSAHFFRRAFHLLGEHGSFGFIATNTIAQGDTRATGLKYLVDHGGHLYDAVRSMKWPVTGANVSVSVVHLAKGHVSDLKLESRLDRLPVKHLNSRLRGKAERADPVVLRANAGKSFQGSIVLGMGFVLSPEQRSALIAKSPKNAERIFRYVGGEEINSDPSPELERYVINFGQMELKDAKQWPDLIHIVQEQVKPERDKSKDKGAKHLWWQYIRPRQELYQTLRPLHRCLVNSQVSKHLVFDWRPTGGIFSHAAYVYTQEQDRWLAVLQSRAHEAWARLLSSSMRNDLRYTPSSCFETFPFPEDARGATLDAIGKRLHFERSQYIQAHNIGLTTTYNRLKDRSVTDAATQRLRDLHVAVDQAVLDAYGWNDLHAPPYCGATPKQLDAFEDEVLDRLFDLNEQRAHEEAHPTSRRPSKSRTQTA